MPFINLDFFYNGKFVYMDHGMNLKSIFIHMNTITVEKGDFVNAFAANDPQSTLKTWNIIFEYVKGSRKTAVFLNTRPDRQVRTQQLLDLVFSSMKADYVIVRGENLESDVKSRYENMNKIDYSIFSYDDSSSKIIDKISTLDEYLIVGIGNIVGWGEEFMRKLKGYKND